MISLVRSFALYYINDSATTPTYTLSLHDALPIFDDLNVRTLQTMVDRGLMPNLKTHVIDKAYKFTEAYVTRSMGVDRKSTRLNQSRLHLVCRLLLEKKNYVGGKTKITMIILDESY